MLSEALNKPDGKTKYITNAVLKKMDGTAYASTGSPYQQCVLNDGERIEKVKIWQGNSEPLTGQYLGQKLQFNVGGKVFNGKTYLSGFWNERAQVNQGDYTPPAQPTQPQGTQATPAMPANAYSQKPIPPQTKQPAQNEWEARDDARQDMIMRQTAGKCAAWTMAAFIAKGGDAGLMATDGKIKKVEADWWLHYFKTGEDKNAHMGTDENDPKF